MGEIALSPEMGHLMMYAYDGAEYLRTGIDGLRENERTACEDPRLLLAYMDEAERYMSPPDQIETFQQCLEDGLPGVRREVYQQPLNLVCPP